MKAGQFTVSYERDGWSASASAKDDNYNTNQGPFLVYSAPQSSPGKAIEVAIAALKAAGHDLKGADVA